MVIGDDKETLIGAYSSKEEALENAWKTMQEFEGEHRFEDKSETVGEAGGVVLHYEHSQSLPGQTQ